MTNLDLKLTQNFRLFEFIHSDIAWTSDSLRYAQLEFSHEVFNNIKLVASVLQDVRTSLGIPIYVNSGFRSKLLNDKLRELGYDSHPQSKHLIGRAADVRGSDYNMTHKIWTLLKKHKSVDTEHSYFKSLSKRTYIHFQLKNNIA